MLLMAPTMCRAAWEMTLPGEPNRNWGVGVSSGVQYDDNFNSSETHRISGFRYTSDLTLGAKIPGVRSLFSGAYDYGVVYPANIPKVGGVNQSHALNISENYSLNPRLSLSLNDSFVNSIQPQLVQGVSGAPATVIQSGTYLYNLVGASVSYSLTPRWTTSLSGNWDIWSYQEPIYATNYNHEDYSMTLSALYAVDPRTILGVNYQYTVDTFTNPGFRNGLDAYSNTGYISMTHHFNPKLALVLNGGYTVRNSADGTTSTAPSGYGSLIYNYGPLDTISFVMVQSLSSASLAYTRSFSAQQTTSLDLQVNHRFTVRLHTALEASYSYNSFTAQLLNQQLQLQNAKPSYESITAHWALVYDFRVWLSAGLDYFYTRLLSADVNLVQPFSHDQVGVRLTLRY
jgi:hypothetical protein